MIRASDLPCRYGEQVYFYTIFPFYRNNNIHVGRENYTCINMQISASSYLHIFFV